MLSKMPGVAALLILAGWAPLVDAGDPAPETLERFDPSRRRHFGEFYNPAKYRRCRSETVAHNRRCDIYKLTRTEVPIHFPNPAAPPPRLPELSADSGYRWWMTDKQYFDHLCATEAKKVIYRRVHDVEGVFQMRPRPVASDLELRDRYVMQDPYGYTLSEARRPGLAMLGPGRYRFMEAIPTPEIPGQAGRGKNRGSVTRDARATYVRYSGYDGKRLSTVRAQYVDEVASGYGYLWRDIERPHDRESGIAGGELIVLDLRTHDVLAFWRGFQRTLGERRGKGRVWWLSGELCPPRRKIVRDTYEFLTEVLVPSP